MSILIPTNGLGAGSADDREFFLDAVAEDWGEEARTNPEVRAIARSYAAGMSVAKTSVGEDILLATSVLAVIEVLGPGRYTGDE